MWEDGGEVLAQSLAHGAFNPVLLPRLVGECSFGGIQNILPLARLPYYSTTFAIRSLPKAAWGPPALFSLSNQEDMDRGRKAADHGDGRFCSFP